MNVVGRFGSLISKGVYTIATPIHPFSGAVDVIVVQQQDGTFRSTPWYVQFGRFQGVLKGAEKIVRVTVNGVEANFHMYLDNSGEAYFIREVDSTERSELEEAIKDTSREENKHDAKASGYRADNSNYGSNSPRVNRIQRVDTMYYEFDDDCFLEDAFDFSEGTSDEDESREKKSLEESRGVDAEVVLVSVDGRLVKAPVLASEQATKNVQSNTSQHREWPGDGLKISEDLSAENEQVKDVDKLVANGEYSVSEGDTAVGQKQESCHGVAENAARRCEALNVVNHEGIKQDARDDEITDSETTSLQLEAESNFKTVSEARREEHKIKESDTFEEGSNGKLDFPGGPDSPGNRCLPFQSLEKESCELTDGNISSVNVKIADELVSREASLRTSLEDGGIGGSSSEAERRECTSLESHAGRLVENAQSNARTRFEISLCGDDLRKGIGVGAAAQVFEAHRISPEEYKRKYSAVVESKNLIVRIGEKYLTWEKAAPFVLGAAVFGSELPVEPNDAIPVEQVEIAMRKDDETCNSSSYSRRTWRLWPIPFTRAKTLDHTNSSSSNEDVFVDTESDFHSAHAEQPPTPKKQFIRTNVPTSEEVASLNLKDGQNVVTFSFSSRVLGSQQVEAYIYLWQWNARIVISDVDGTITRSDVMGQVMPLVGRDWTQSGVATLFSAIKENGYHLLFLSARAIVQAYLTRNFLLNLKQDGKALPSGPVVISPDGLVPSLYREVIRRAPHEFKIACLEDIKNLFPPDHNPFYAGFGNRDTDELSYMKMGIPKGKIFIINPKGEVATSHRIGVKSYTSLHTLVNDMFPPTSIIGQVEEVYNSWNFWKLPMREMDL